jgi:hypothetical protein
MPMGPARERFPLPVAVFLFALLTNFAWLAVDRELTSDDSPTYIGPAQNLAGGRGFLNVNLVPETRRTPGYPLFLAPFMFSPRGLVYFTMIQAVLNAVLAAAVAWFALRQLGDTAAAAVAGVAFALDLSSLHHAAQILTETFFTVFVFAMFLLLATQRSVIQGPLVAGVIGGAAVLVRPIGAYLFVPVVAALLLQQRSRRILHAIVFCTAFLLLPLAWAERNAGAGAGRTISTITSWSILFDRGAGTLAIAQHGSFDSNVLAARVQLARQVGDPFSATYSNHVQRRGDWFHTDRYAPLAFRILASHPLQYLRVWLRGVARTMFGGGARLLEDLLGMPASIAKVVVLLYTAPLALFAVAGLPSWLGARRHATLLALAIVAYLLVTCSVAEPSARFRVPMMPFLALWCGGGFTDLLRRWRPPASPPAAEH